jgi:hypothetical protein
MTFQPSEQDDAGVAHFCADSATGELTEGERPRPFDRAPDSQWEVRSDFFTRKRSDYDYLLFSRINSK